MSKVWNTTGWLEFSDMGENKFLIEFQKEEDRQRVIKGRPWSLDRWLEVFWLQVDNMPLAYMTQEVRLHVGKCAGKVLDVIVDQWGLGWGKFLRLKVEVHITKALVKSILKL
ncbi:uncharacterized protein LOC121267095 [Juglans microcarpa x Juglans regia]|uniref:uncharacterized protein LOC121267095 n=1 Tax=Juglans microcarpa x Juglans regia TaxID=2249226 RepID=UPI001B7EC1E9|nr:uncharacterized protein LOC121267095 [Juglans microcarpa x Juglans regia]